MIPVAVTITSSLVPEAVRLGPGEGLTFGRTRELQREPGLVSIAGEAHLAVSTSPRLHGVAGRIEVLEDGWLLANEGRWLHLRLVDSGGGDQIDLDPGRSVRVPWSPVAVQVATGEEVIELLVTCPVLERDSRPAPPVPTDTVRGLDLDRHTGYFRALVALCAPQLREPASSAVSTVGEIVVMLQPVPAEGDRVTAKAVERRLAHVRRRVGIGATPDEGSVAGLELRDASRRLVDLALRTGTVTAADLALLEAEPASPGPMAP